MDSKRTVSTLIPYRIMNDKCPVHLQKKSEDAPRAPGYFGFWGGGMNKGETPDQTLEREIQEELGIELKSYNFFGKYDQKAIKNVYTIEVSDDFENNIRIGEGDYGKWFSREEASSEPKFGEGDKIVLQDFYKSLMQNK